METVRHRSVETIWLFDYPSLLSLDDCPDRMVWLSQRDLNILWQATTYIDRWRTRVFTSSHGKTYTLASPDEFSEFQEWVSTMRVRLGAYPMCNEILQEIADNLAALVNRPCCPSGGIGGGSFGAGMEEGAPVTQQSGETEREGDPPGGFEDWEEYDTYKCSMANYIIDRIIFDIATAGVLAAGYSGAVALAGALVGALLTPVGWAVLIGLAGLALSWFVLGAEVSLLTSFMESKRDELVCAMVNASNVSSSISDYANVISDSVPEDTGISALGSVAEYIAVGYLKSFATVDSFNGLYDKVPYAIPDAECPDCGPAGEYEVYFGEDISEDPPANPIFATSIFEDGRGCGANARATYISFAVPSTISSIIIVNGEGACIGTPIYWYATNPGFTSAYTSNAAPQIEGSQTGVSYLAVIFDTTLGDPHVIVTHTPT